MFVELVEVGPRDGLQNEEKILPPKVRAELCDKLAAAGVPRVEAASFVNPKRVPQMVGAEEVMAAINRREGTSYAGLVLNEKGYERAVAAGVDEARYAFPVTETFAKRNQNTTVADATNLAGRLVERAREDGVKASITLSAAFGYPFEGGVDPRHVLSIAEKVAASRTRWRPSRRERRFWTRQSAARGVARSLRRRPRRWATWRRRTWCICCAGWDTRWGSSCKRS
jgi:isopropylmalate/homocitrate/citramalate synthase